MENKINIDLLIRNFTHEIIAKIESSGLSPGIMLYIFKDLEKQLEELYTKSCNNIQQIETEEGEENG